MDDVLCISHRPEHVFRSEIGKYFYVKEGSVGPPTIYLGNKVSKVTLDNVSDAWSFSSSKYVQAAISNLEKYLKEQGHSILVKAKFPFISRYWPGIDISNELNLTDAVFYQSLIDFLYCIRELGQADITIEVLMILSCILIPGKYHLEKSTKTFLPG